MGDRFQMVAVRVRVSNGSKKNDKKTDLIGLTTEQNESIIVKRQRLENKHHYSCLRRETNPEAAR